MKTLLLLLLLFCQQDNADKLLNDLNDDDPVVRQTATKMLTEREQDLNRYRALSNFTSDPEIRWRLKWVIQTIEMNQKFRSMSTLAPAITLKFEGTAEELFVKLAAITHQKFDARSFGNSKVSIDVTDANLFQVLDLVTKQIGYEWMVGYDFNNERINNATNGLEIGLSGPVVNYNTVVELTANGFSDKTPHSTVSGFKMQVVSTNMGIVNKFGEVITELAVMYKFVAEPGLKYAIGPKLEYTKILNDQGIGTVNHSGISKIALITVPPATKSIKIAGKARYRVPLKVETIIMHGVNLAKEGELFSTDNSRFVIKIESGRIQIHTQGDDNLISERFTGKVTIRRPVGDIMFGGDSGNPGGYISTYPDYFEIYFYSTTSTDCTSVEFEYITEFRDVQFDFSIDSIPLY
jgi:hypothetical protein